MQLEENLVTFLLLSFNFRQPEVVATSIKVVKKAKLNCTGEWRNTCQVTIAIFSLIFRAAHANQLTKFNIPKCPRFDAKCRKRLGKLEGASFDLCLFESRPVFLATLLNLFLLQQHLA